MLIKTYEPMDRHLSFNCGGKAKFFVEPKNIKELIEVIDNCQKEKKNFFILGNGTNVLCGDKGYNGTVICTRKLTSIQLARVNDGHEVIVEAGVNLTKLNKFLADCSVSGLEWSYGIPGTVGGATYMNAGAFGGQFFDHVKSVDVFENGKIKKLKKEKIKFSYRNGGISGIILKVKLFFPFHTEVDIHSKQMEYLQKRIDAQPLNYPSAGSVFKRKDDVIPAQIIDNIGLKGAIIGKAMISDKHAGFIINLGGATTKNVLDLISLIKQKVYTKVGKTLEEEIIVIGET